VTVEPPLNAHEIAYLRKFARSRRMSRLSGPYFVEGSSGLDQVRNKDVIDYNRAAEGQPGLWCDWEPNDEGTEISWNGTEKFYLAEVWMAYLIDHFLKPGASAAGSAFIDMVPAEFAHFTFDHHVNGTITAQGADPNDQWRLVVADNVVSQLAGH
jgi:hypothetical protein